MRALEVDLRIGMLFSAVLFVSSCGPELPAPTLETVVPNWAYNGEITEVSITGDNLFPYVLVSETSDDGSRFDAQYRATLENDQQQYELSGVSLTEYGTLSALVGEGLEPGEYELSLVSPDGDSSINSVPFIVTDSRADHLDIFTEHVVYEVNDYAVVYLSVLDADERVVESALPVTFSVTSAIDAEGVIIQDGGLTGFSFLEEEVGVSGSLGADGLGYVVLTSTIPDELEIAIEVDGQSVVIGDDGSLVFGTGAVEQVLLELPSEPFQTTAGEEFYVSVTLLDRYGNVVENRPADLWLQEECGNYMTHMPVVGQQEVQLAVSGATGGACAVNKIIATGDVVGESPGFTVSPASPVNFLVDDVTRTLGDGIVIAGETLMFDLYPLDPFGNLTEELGQFVEVTDNKSSTGSYECLAATSPVRWSCEVNMEVTSTEVVLSFEDDTGVAANTTSFSVLSDIPTALDVTSATAIVAGEAFEVRVAVFDRFGNIVDVDPVVNPFDFGGTNFSQISCNWDSSDSTGYNIFICREFVANSSTVFSVKNVDLSVSGSSDVVNVVNGDLSYVDVSISDSNITAGDSTEILISAFDMWDNPYLVQSDPSIELSDGLGGLSPTVGTLSSGGDLLMSIVLELAGDPVIVEVSQSGNSLGSGSIVVGHGLADSISVNTSETWGWVGETTGVAVTVIDAFGNPVKSFSDTVTLFGASDQFDEIEISDFTDGVGKSEMFWLDSGLSISILADGGGISGGSTLFDVLEPDCQNPPEPDLVFAGSGGSSEVLCLNSGLAGTTADFSGTNAGSSPLFSYHLSIGENYVKRTTSSSQSVQLKSEGYGLATLVVADQDACGAVAFGEVAIGLNDGSAAGEVIASSSSQSLVAGSNSNGVSTISVEAFDCTGDVASNSSVIVRSNLGEVDPSRVSLVESGEGLVLQLDASGTGSFQYSVEDSNVGGAASIAIGTSNFSAYGGVDVTVVGDDRQPRVLWQSPVGRVTETIDEVVVQMSESILPVTITETSVVLTNSLGEVVPSNIIWDSSETTVTISPDDPLDGSGESFSVSVLGTLRDDNGNFLDGDYSGNAVGTPWVAEFGNLSDSGISLVSCSAVSTVFYPDGDESGTLSQADIITVSIESSIIGATAVLEVYSVGGELIRTQRESIASTTTVSMEWDGRDELGAVQASGVWSLDTYIEDNNGNPSDVCSIDVALRQNIMDY